MKAFIELQFGYSPSVCMLQNWSFNNKINRLQKRVSRITYNDKSSSFQKLYEKNISVAIHNRNV